MTTSYRKGTRVQRAGRPSKGWVNAPVVRGSTYVFDRIEDWRDVRSRRDQERLLSYGTRGTNTTHALEDALVELEGGYRAQLYPTGLAAINIMLLAYLRSGDHMLVTDAVYGPVRGFCADFLGRLGIEYTFYAPDGSDLQEKIRPNTRLIYAECPGSLLYEMVDLPALASIARAHDCLLAVDNTWASGVLYNPLSLGADISILAATKYLGGHADVVMGAVVANEQAWPALAHASISFGQTVGADDAFLVLRGIRSLALRMQQHGQSALQVAQWLQQHPEVRRVWCPALQDDPGHRIWKRDFTGTNGLITVEFDHQVDDQKLENIIDALRLFGLGSSWGGYESLVTPVVAKTVRTVENWDQAGRMMRLHIGLEDPQDLIDDLNQAFTEASAAYQTR